MPDFTRKNLSREELVRQIVDHLDRLKDSHVVMEGVTLAGRTGMIILLPVELQPVVLDDVMRATASGIDKLLRIIEERPYLRVDRPHRP